VHFFLELVDRLEKVWN
jgi:hypothetical protein